MATEILPLSGAEMAFRQCHNIMMQNPMTLNTYYTTMFDMFRGLLDEYDLQQMEMLIKSLEDFLSDDLNPMTMREAEIRMFQNMDLLSGFIVNNDFITQMQINDKLEEIKGWLSGLLYGKYLKQIRFTVPMRVD